MANSAQDQQPTTIDQKPDIPDFPPPAMNNEPASPAGGLPTINKHGFLPRLGPKQLIVLLAIVAILLVIGFFVFDKEPRVTKTSGLEQKSSETANILSLLSDVKYATSEADSKDFYNVIKYSVENDTDDYWSAAVNIQFACQEKVKTPEEKAKLKEAFDEIIKHVPKEKLEATASPYIWYCP